MWERFKECFGDGLLIFAGIITFERLIKDVKRRKK